MSFIFLTPFNKGVFYLTKRKKNYKFEQIFKFMRLYNFKPNRV